MAHVFVLQSHFAPMILCPLLLRTSIFCTRYVDGERLTSEDERIVVDRLLAHHPHAEDKIGCGLEFIMVCFGLD